MVEVYAPAPVREPPHFRGPGRKRPPVEPYSPEQGLDTLPDRRPQEKSCCMEANDRTSRWAIRMRDWLLSMAREQFALREAVEGIDLDGAGAVKGVTPYLAEQATDIGAYTGGAGWVTGGPSFTVTGVGADDVLNISATAPVELATGGVPNPAKCRIQNTTTGTTVWEGVTGFAANGDIFNMAATLALTVDAADLALGSNTYELQFEGTAPATYLAKGVASGGSWCVLSALHIDKTA